MSLPCIFAIDEFLREPDRRLLDDHAAETIAAACRATGRTAIWIEGFSLAGKTTLADVVGRRLAWRVVHLDQLASRREVEPHSYAAAMGTSNLQEALGSSELRKRVVVEGICLRDVLLSLADRRDALTVYLMRVCYHAGRLRWDDWYEIERGVVPADWTDRCAYDYHRRTHPERDADLTFARIE